MTECLLTVCKCLSAVIFAFMAVLLFTASYLMIFSTPADQEDTTKHHAYKYHLCTSCLYMVALLIATPAAIWVLRSAYSDFLRRVAALVVLIWLHLYSGACNSILRQPRPASLAFFEKATVSVLKGSSILVLITSFSLIQHRLNIYHAEMLQPLHHRRTNCLFVIGIAAAILSFMADMTFVGALGTLIYVLCMSGWTLLVLCDLRSMRALASRDTHLKGCRVEEAQHMATTLLHQFVGIAIHMSIHLIAVIFYNVLARMGPLNVTAVTYASLVSLPNVLDHLSNLFMSLALGGCFAGAPRAAAKHFHIKKIRKERWRRSSESFKGNESHSWDATVEDLAGRGLSLEKLLEFYQSLGVSAMMHFNPSLSTTDDVVHGAIIPMSKQRGQALATILMDGAKVYPKRMVTHNWSNIFRDLIAAVLADALEEKEFDIISHMLEHDLSLLCDLVKKRQVGRRTYWICAFSVNQHAGICGGNPYGSRDTVTKELYTVCTCTTPKYFNSSPPTLPNGQSIHCEMNKFHNMMMFLSKIDPTFEQVVAVDSDFHLFGRAWCVAEIATANTCGMKQHLKIYSSKKLAEHSEHLKNLKIENMQSTRPEDKREILDGIPDVALFNLQLRDLIFKELLPAWRDLDAEQQASLMGRLARWQLACDSQKDCSLQQIELARLPTSRRDD